MQALKLNHVSKNGSQVTEAWIFRINEIIAMFALGPCVPSSLSNYIWVINSFIA